MNGKLHLTLLAVICAMFLDFSETARSQVSFFQPPAYAGAGTLFVADFNGDSKPDLLSGDGALDLGAGNGIFTAGTHVSGKPVAVADFNGDGRADILEQTTGTLVVLLGIGNGRFQAPVNSASGANLSVVAAADLNGDGKADVVGLFNSVLLVYISKGDATFATGISYNLGGTVLGLPGISFGDFDGDHIIDIAVTASISSSQELVFMGKGDGTFQAAKTSILSYAETYAAAGDFNGDGKLDLALSPDPPAGGMFYVLLGNGDGTFQTPIAAGPGDGPTAVADLNGDGNLDLIFESTAEGPAHVDPFARIYLGNGDGTFFNASNYVLGISNLPFSTGVAITDLNSDGKPDLVAGNAVLFGNGDGIFQGIQLGVGAVGPAVIADFDKSGAPGLASFSGIGVSVYRNEGDGMLWLADTYPVQSIGAINAILAADLDGDGNLDLFVSNSDGRSWDFYCVLLGVGDGSFQAPVCYPQYVYGSPYSAIAGDFRNNHQIDVALAPGGGQSLELLLGNGNGTFATPQSVFDGDAYYLLGADFNRDGNIDIAVGGTSGTHSSGILLGNGDGTFQPAVFPSSLGSFTSMFTTDLNSDGIPDLLSYNQVALGNGDATFTPLPVLPSTNIATVADLNSDGKPDLIVNLNFGQKWAILLGKGDGTFASGIDIVIPSGPMVADMNADGRPDLVFPWAGGFGVMLNTTPPDFGVSASPTSQSLSVGQSATYSVMVTPSGQFAGTVKLNCEITPAVTPALTCSLSSSSVEIKAGAPQSVTVTVATIAPVSTGRVFPFNLPPSRMPAFWMILFIGCGCLVLRNHRGLPKLATPLIGLALAPLLSCAGSSSLLSHVTHGTPSGAYTATITATCGGLSHNLTFKVIVK